MQELIRKVFYDYLTNYSNTAFKLTENNRLGDLIDKTLNTLTIPVDENKYVKLQRKVNDRIQLQKKNYNQLVGHSLASEFILVHF